MTLNVNNFGISTHVHWFLNCLDKMLKLRQFKFLQNSRNWILNMLFMYLLHCMLYVCLSTYAKNNKPVRLENLTSGLIFFRVGFIWLVWGNSFLNDWFGVGPYIHYTQKDNNFSREGYTKQLSKGGGASSSLHPNFRCTLSLAPLPGYGPGKDLYYNIAPI